MGTPASNLKSFISCEGLEILNLRPEDIEECLADAVAAFGPGRPAAVRAAPP